MAQKFKPNRTQADRVIAILGGVRPASRLTGIAATTISGWRQLGFVPSNRQQLVINKAYEAGVRLLPTDFLQYPPQPETPPAE